MKNPIANDILYAYNIESKLYSTIASFENKVKYCDITIKSSYGNRVSKFSALTPLIVCSKFLKSTRD